MEAAFEDVRILICDHKIAALKDMLPLLDQMVKTGRPLLVVAEDIEGDALATLIVNGLRGAALLRGQGAVWDRRKAILQDIAVLTGGKVISEELGLVKRVDRGSRDRQACRRRQGSTTIVGGGGAKAAIEARILAIRREIEALTSDYDKGESCASGWPSCRVALP